MNKRQIRATEMQRKMEPVHSPEQTTIRQQAQGLVQQIAPQAANQRAQVNRNGLRPADLLALQRMVGNRRVQRMVVRRVDNTNDRQQKMFLAENPGILAQTKFSVGTPKGIPKQEVDHLSNTMMPTDRLPCITEQKESTTLANGPTQRQMEEKSEIPPELQTSVDITRLNRVQLQQRLNLIEQTLMLLNRSTPDTERLKQEVEGIPAELEKKKQIELEQIRQSKCPSTIDADKIVVDHRVEPTEINKPGDKVTFTVAFVCIVRYGGYSKFVGSNQSVFSRQPFGAKNQLIREWDGKRPFPKVGTYMVDDGTYYHELENVKYAVKGKTDLFATGPNLKSPPVRVNVRGFDGTGGPQSHNTLVNVATLAAIIQSEIGVGNEDEQKAIAWCVRNQMVRLGTVSVATARAHFQDAHNQPATPQIRAIAEEILKKPISDDTTGGAIKWFSPRSMPKAGDSCAKFNCGGGLTDMTDDAGNKVKVYTPDFHKSMKYIPIASVREWFLRVYAL